MLEDQPLAPATPSRFALYLDLIRQTSLRQLGYRARRILRNLLLSPVRNRLAATADDPAPVYQRLSRQPDFAQAARLWRKESPDAGRRLLAEKLESLDHRGWPWDQTFWEEATVALQGPFMDFAGSLVSQAEESLKREFSAEGSTPLALGKEIDWDPPEFVHCEKTFSLNRLYHLPVLALAARVTREQRFADEIAELLDQWLSANRIREGRPWNELTTALRLNSILLAWACLRGSDMLSPRTHEQVMVVLHSHADYLESHLEYDILNNHLVFEGRTLLMAASLMPDNPESKRWFNAGWQALVSEFDHEIRQDGTHGEQSAGYHMQVLLEYLTALRIRQSNGQSVPEEWNPRLTAMTECLADMLRPDGTPPLSGDTAHDDPQTPWAAEVLQVAGQLLELPSLYEGGAVLPRSFLLLGSRHPRAIDPLRSRSAGSRAYPDGGLVILRNSDRQNPVMLSMDAGPFAMSDSPAHGHADALQIEYSANGHPLLVDPGAYTYEPGPWRAFFRGTAAHNTIMLEGLDQVHLWGAFRAFRPNGARLLDFGSTDEVRHATGEYIHSTSGLIHRRHVALLPKGAVLLVDDLRLRGQHRLRSHFHFAPGSCELTEATGNERTCRYLHESGSAGLELRLMVEVSDALILEQGSESPPQGWISHAKGSRVAAPVLAWSRTMEHSTRFCCLLMPRNGEDIDSADIRLERGTCTITQGACKYSLPFPSGSKP